MFPSIKDIPRKKECFVVLESVRSDPSLLFGWGWNPNGIMFFFFIPEIRINFNNTAAAVTPANVRMARSFLPLFYFSVVYRCAECGHSYIEIQSCCMKSISHDYGIAYFGHMYACVPRQDHIKRMVPARHRSYNSLNQLWQKNRIL